MNERDMQSIMESVPIPMLLVGQNERIEAINTPASSLFGVDSVGLHYISVLRQPAILEAIEAVLMEDLPRDTYFKGYEAGRETRYNVRCAPVAKEDNKGIAVTFNDVTDLRTAGRMRRDFVANVSHELRTPLTAILGFIETLRGAARDDAATRDRFLAIMEREAGRMDRLVQDLLSLSRVEEEERRRPTGMIDIGAVVAVAVKALRPLADRGNVEISLDVPEGSIEIPGDADQLQQVFTNLVENAIKYGGSDGFVSVIVTRSETEIGILGRGVRIDVTDRGEGIPDIHLARLTERFYRVDNHRSREMGGTGLGLAIVKHIVNRHRGRLRIHSEIGRGSRFSVTLPAD